MRLHSIANLFFSITIILSIGFNYRLGGFFHGLFAVYWWMLFLSTFTIIFLFAKSVHRKIFLNPTPLFFVTLLILYGSLSFFFEGGRFVLEYGKYSFVLICFYLFSIIFVNFKIPFESIIYAIVIGVIISIFTIGIPDLTNISIAKRLEATMLGGFNTYGVLLANAMLCIIYLMDKEKKYLRMSAFLFGWFLMGFMLLSTLSRGAMLGLIVGAMVYLYTTKRKWLFSGGIIALILALCLIYGVSDNIITSRFLNLESVSSGSGRLEVWSKLWNDILLSPSTLLLGSGLGSFNTAIAGGTAYVNSAHNMYFQWFHDLGFVAFIIYISLYFSFHSILVMHNDLHRPIYLAVFCQLATSLVFDAHIQSAQLGWFFALWYAVFLSTKHYRATAHNRVREYKPIMCQSI